MVEVLQDVPEYKKLSDAQVDAIIGVGILNAILLSSTLAFAIYNTGAHLIRLKIKRTLILLFYLLTYCLMSFRLVDTAETIFKPTLNKFDYNTHKASIGNYFRSASECALVGLGFLIVATMYQLSCSLQLVVNVMTVEQVNFRRNVVYILCTIATLAFTSLVTAIYFIENL